MSRKIVLVSILTGFAALCGCDSSVKSVRVPYGELPEEAVLISVDGNKYTKGDFERDLAIRMELLKLSFTKMDERQVETARTEFRRQALRQFVTRELLIGEAKRRGIELSGSELLTYQEQFARGLSKRFVVSFEMIERLLGERVTGFRQSIRSDALSQKVSAQLRKEAMSVPMPTAQEAEETLREAKACNEQFAITNRMVYAKATNAWKSVKSGMDIAAVGESLQKAYRFARYFAACDTDNARVAALAKGELTPPLTLDDGVAIFKVNEAAGVTNRYSCIYFTLPPTFVISSVRETQQKLHAARVEEAYKAAIDALRRKAAIRYPYGEHPFHD